MQANIKEYTTRHYRSYTQYNRWLQACFLTAIAHIGLPESALLKSAEAKSIVGGLCDYGCGTGIIVATAWNLGVFPAMGLELSKNVQPVLHKDAQSLVHLLDLSDVIDWGAFRTNFKFNFQWATEIADHIAPENRDNFCANLANTANDGAYLILTVQEEGRTYWQGKLYGLGYYYAASRTDELASIWSMPSISGPCTWLPNNLMVFRFETEDKHVTR